MNADTEYLETVPAHVFYSRSKHKTTFVPPLVRPNAVVRSAVLSSKKIDDCSREPLRSFPTQQLAFDFADARSPHAAQVWAYEIDQSGRRRFIVASTSSFWRWYRTVLRRQAPLHVYEVIREGKPCRLYFDLEFRRTDSETRALNGRLLTDSVVATTAQLLEDCYGVTEARRAANCVVLNSTTDDKFSVHLIFPDIVFENNCLAGEFVSVMVDRLPEICRKLSFVDTSVYTKNRCFRLIASSKFGRSSRLLPDDLCAKHDSVKSRSGGSSKLGLSQKLFSQSLICNADMAAAIILRTSSSSSHAVSADEKFKRTKEHPEPSTIPNMYGSSKQFQSQRSDFSKIDEYVRLLVQPHGGSIYTVSYFAETKTLSYAIKGRYRYCHRIGRHHRSNNVVLVVNIQSREMYQRCFDPDCRTFRSLPWRLPDPVFAGVAQGDTDSSGDDKFDDLLVQYMDKFDLEMKNEQTFSGGVPDEVFLELFGI